VFGALWTTILYLIGKLIDLSDLPGLDYEQQRRLEPIVRRKVARLWRVAWINLTAALVFFAVIVLMGEKDPAKALLYVGFVALFVSGAFLCLLPGWVAEIQKFKWKMKEREKMIKARADAIAGLKAAGEGGDFKSDPGLDSYNTVWHQ
jgi:hypothetical protein